MYIRIKKDLDDIYRLSEEAVTSICDSILAPVSPSEILGGGEIVWKLNRNWYWVIDDYDKRRFKSIDKLWKYTVKIGLKHNGRWEDVELNFDTKDQLLLKLEPYRHDKINYIRLKMWWKEEGE